MKKKELVDVEKAGKGGGMRWGRKGLMGRREDKVGNGKRRDT